MKKILARNNPRAVKAQDRQANPTQSQSPPQSQLIKKIQFTHHETVARSDMSLQENLIFKPAQEEVVDFRVEIERRFQKSTTSKGYVFKRKERYSDRENGNEESCDDESLDSLKHVTIYDLNSQNQNRIRHRATEKQRPERVSNTSKGKDGRSYNVIANVADSSIKRHQVEPGKKNEVLKPMFVYKKLFNLLDRQALVAPSSAKNTSSSSSRRNVLQDKFKNILTQRQEGSKDKSELRKKLLTTKISERNIQYSAQISKSKENNPRSQERPKEHYSYRINNEYSILNGTKTNNEKTQSREQGNSVEASSIIGDKSLRNILSPLNKGPPHEKKRFKQESLKKIYNNNLLKMITPHCQKSIIKTNNEESYLQPQPQSLLHNLYQKAQNDIISGKVKPPTAKIRKQDSTATLSILSPTQREQTPKADVKNLNLISSYGSPSTLTTLHSSQSRASKKNSSKHVNLASPDEHRKENMLYMPAHILNNVVIKRSPIKLDLSKRAEESREALTSGRNRTKILTEKYSDLGGHQNDSGLRVSYDSFAMHNSFGINLGQKQQHTAHKTVGLTPNNSTVKLISNNKGGPQLK